MKNITQLEIEGVKRIKAVSITPEGNAIVIGGNNAQGKTSILDAIEMALGGGKTIPPKPIHDGMESARIVLKMDGLIVTRTFTEKKSYLKVTTEDGASYPGAQAMLDTLVGRLSLDPLAFTNLSPKEQAETLRKLIGLNTAEIDQTYGKTFAERTDLNRAIKQLEARLESMERDDDAPSEEVSVSELIARRSDIAQRNQEITDREKIIESMTEDRDRLAREIESMKLKIQDYDSGIAAQSEELKSLGDSQSTDHIDDEIRNAEHTNITVRENKRYDEINDELISTTSKADACTDKLESLKHQKSELIAAAEYPIDGLGINEESIVTYNGIPFEQASGAERLRISAAIGLALNPKMGVLLVRDASLLDADSMAALLDFASEKGAQVWMERVGNGDECTVIIEDGMVVGGEDHE